MNSSLEVLKKIYKPYRYTIKGNVIVLNTNEKDLIVKKKPNKDLKETFKYLKSRGFNNFPDILDDTRDEVNVFEYIEDTKMPKEQKASDLINTIASLHNKTTYYKVVSDDVFKSIYDTIEGNINYLEHYYNTLINNIKKIEYPSPSEYLIIRNSSKIFSCLNFCESELKNWFELVKNENKQRVSLIHNNLSLNHFIKNDKEYLISWDKSKIDSPILDLIKFYENSYFDLDFNTLFEMYQNKYPLTDSEKKLFFISISLPKKIEIKKSEFDTCIEVRKTLDYLFKTESLVRPYYSIDQKDK